MKLINSSHIQNTEELASATSLTFNLMVTKGIPGETGVRGLTTLGDSYSGSPKIDPFGSMVEIFFV